jgi:hypothetical protein
MKSLHRSNPSDIAIAPVVASILAVLMHQTYLWLQAIIGWLRVRIWYLSSIYQTPVVLPGAFALNAAHQSLTIQGVGTTWLYLQVLWTMIHTSYQSAAFSGISKLLGSKILTIFQSSLSILLTKNS